MLKTKTTAAVLGGAVVLASAGYAIGSQTGGGSASAQPGATTTATTPYGAPPGGPWKGRGHWRGGPDADLSTLAGKLGVSTSALRSAFDAIRAQLGPRSGQRDEHEADLAQALGVTQAQLDAALTKLRPARRADPGEPAQALASKLGIDAAKVRAAFDALRAKGPQAGDPLASLAKALGVDEAKLRAAMQAAGPRGGPGPHPHPDDTAFAGDLAKALGLDASKVEAALAKLRTRAEADHKAKEDKLASALAAKLGLDANKVKDALAAVPHHGRHGP
jgi:Clp amino terminal domain, pathogenicity island component